MYRNRETRKNYFTSLWLLLTVLTITLSGCMIKAHLWQEITTSGEEPSGYAVYTYVLVNSTQYDPITWNKYAKLVQSIKNSTPNAKEINQNFDKSLYNLFLIPSKEDLPESNEILNETLSKSILTKIAESTEDKKLQNSINTNPGPYLISVLEPIGTQISSKDIDILYVDLTRTNIDATNEVIASYKKRLSKNKAEGVENFKSIRLSLLNLILDADDCIKIVKIAYADLIK